MLIINPQNNLKLMIVPLHGCFLTETW